MEDGFANHSNLAFPVKPGKGQVAIIGTRGYPSFYGGFETLIRRLAPFLVDDDWTVVVYGRPERGGGPAVDADRRVVQKTTRGFERKSLSTISYGFTATIDAIRRGVDIALVMNVANGFWLPLLKVAGIRTVVNVDGIEWERAKWGRIARIVFRMGARMTARYADELVFDAEAIGNYWKTEFGRTGTYIPYGGDLSYETVDVPEFVQRSYILAVARFVPENSIGEFLDAVSTIENVDVVVVGSSGYGGAFETRLTAMVESRSNIHWLGHVRDDNVLFSLWENCGAYFHGHSVGGTNPALVQAMACGAPTVARDTVYNREVLSDAGYFVRPIARDISASLLSLLNDPLEQERLANCARKRAAERYTWEQVCHSYSDLLWRAK